jgi:DNA polymerase (family X)
MTNDRVPPGKAEVLDALHQIAFGIELQGGNAFQARAYENAARAIKRVEGDLSAMLASGELSKLHGIGKSTLQVVTDVLEGRVPPALQTMREKFGPGLYEIGKLKGIGPVRVKALWEELGITNVGELEYACLENRLLDLEGFGKKTQASILAAIQASREVKAAPEGEELFRRDQAMEAARRTIARMPGARLVGDLAMGAEVVARIEVLAEAAGTETPAGPLPLVVHTAPQNRLGVIEVRLTADDAHWTALQDRAETRGLLLDRTGLVDRDGTVLTVPDADALYAALGLHAIAAERRRAGTLLVGRDAPPQELVRLEDLRGSLHNHTDASDGVDTLEAMRDAARRLGHEYLAITDHSQSARYARGLEPERLEAQRALIRRLNEQGPPFLLSGVESDILPDGALDYPEEILAELDLVVASIHNRNRQDRATLTARILRAVAHPRTAILGHPTGRLLLARPPSDFDMEAVLDACVASGCAVELNAHPHRLDLNPQHLGMARERGVPVSINADAHIGGGLQHLEHGVAIARRAGLRPEHVLNTRPLSQLKAHFRRGGSMSASGTA